MDFLPEMGQQVAIKVTTGLLEGEYDSRVQAIKDNSFWIDPPTAVKTRRLVRLPRGTRLTLTYQDELDKVPYAFDTAVVVGDQNCVVLERPTQILRMQRRQFVRVPVSLAAGLLRVDPSTRTYATLAGEIDNLSGGGMFVRVDRDSKLYVGDITGLNFQLPGGPPTTAISVKARVVHKRMAIESWEPVRVGIEFIDLTETYRQSIIRYVFQRQLELKRA